MPLHFVNYKLLKFMHSKLKIKLFLIWIKIKKFLLKTINDPNKYCLILNYIKTRCNSLDNDYIYIKDINEFLLKRDIFGNTFVQNHWN